LDKNSYVVILKGVRKSIGKRVILKDINLMVKKGTIHVLAGPNGAGKTTTLRVLLGLLKPDKGEVTVLGRSPNDPRWSEVKKFIGYLPEDAGLYERLTGLENLYYYAMLYTAGDKEKASELVEHAKEISGLDEEVLKRRAGSYSKGMKRRLLLARTLMHKPLLAVLDEPTSGLDIESAMKIRRLIKTMSRKGSSIIITTHNLLEAQYVADNVSFIDNGRILCTCTVKEALELYEAENLEEAFIKAVGAKV
jgi:ABC-2 type transport system ATP-binding protein